MASTSVIEVRTELKDNTESGRKSTEANLSKLEASVKKTQTTVETLQKKSKIEVAANFKDYATKGVLSLISKGEKLSGKTWTTTANLRDHATQGVQSLISYGEKISGKTWTATANLRDNVTQGVQSLISQGQKIVGKTWTATANLKDNVTQGVQTLLGKGEQLSKKIWSARAELKDYATDKMKTIISYGDKFAGKTWSVALKCMDYATAPIRGVLDLIKNPITQVVALTGVTMGVADTVSTYMSFEQSMANTRSVTGANDVDMARIEEMAKAYGSSTAFSASQVGDATTVLGTAGWSADAMIDGMGGVLSLASAGDVAIDTSASIVSASLGQWGLAADESDRVANVLAATASSSMTNVTGLGETFAYAGAMAGTLGFSIEDVAIATGLMGNNAIDASMAGTSLRSFFTNLVAPTDSTATAMEQLGLSITDSSGEMNSFYDIMMDLRSGMSMLSETEKSAMAYDLAGSTGMAGLLALVNATEEDFNALTESIYNSEGAAQEMADIRMDTLQGDILALQSAAEGVKIEIGERLSPILRTFVQWATRQMPHVSEAFSSMFDWLDQKKSDMLNAMGKLVWSFEWQEADAQGDWVKKVSLVWDTFVGDPFAEWWDSTGHGLAVEYASKIGTTFGEVLSGGIMALLGVDASGATSEGLSIGFAFGKGFLDGLDIPGIAGALWKGLGNVVSDVGTLLPGGEKATASTVLSAGLLGYGGLKVAQGVGAVGSAAGAVGDLGKSVYQTGKSFFSKSDTPSTPNTPSTPSTPNTPSTPSTPNTPSIPSTPSTPSTPNTPSTPSTPSTPNTPSTPSTPSTPNTPSTPSTPSTPNTPTSSNSSSLGKITSLATSTLGKAMNVVGTVYDFAQGASRAEEWTGSNSLVNQGISGTVSTIAGTGDGIFGEGSILEKVLEVGSSALSGFATGAAVGSVATPIGSAAGGIIGGVTGAISSAIGGENITKFLTGSTDKDKDTTTSNTSLEQITQLETEIQATTGEVVTLGESMMETTMEGKTLLEESLGEFFDVILPEAFSQLWEGLGEELTTLGESATESILEPMNLFFQEALPEGMSGIWESAIESLETSKETAVETLGASTLEFFAIYIPESVQALWDSASIAMVEHGLTAENTVNTGITLFFVTWIPESVQRIWDSGRNTLISSSASASGTVNAGITSFFSSASSSVSGFFSSAQRQMNAAMSSASAAISSLSLSVASASSGSGASVAAYATGGILSTPHLGLVAEDGPEAIIPLSGKRRARGIELWEQAGELLGVKPYAEGGIIGMDVTEDRSESFPVFATGKNSGGFEKSGASISMNFGDINLHVTGIENGNEGDVMGQIRSHLGELSDEIAGQISKALEQVFANMPLAVEY